MRGPNPQNIFKNLGVITSKFGDKTQQEEAHGGLDFANHEGTQIPAITDGQVVKAETGHKQGDNNFGNQIEIRNAAGDTIQLNHLRDVGVRVGQMVRKTDIVGTMGKTGAVYSPSGGDPTHLDLRIVNAFGQYKNPMTYLKNL